MASTREVVEGVIEQGIDEEIIYTITTTSWGAVPSNVSAKVYDMTTSHTDVTATVMPAGSATALGDVITLPVLKLLTIGHTYRVEVKFTAGGNVWEPYFKVRATR